MKDRRNQFGAPYKKLNLAGIWFGNVNKFAPNLIQHKLPQIKYGMDNTIS